MKIPTTTIIIYSHHLKYHPFISPISPPINNQEVGLTIVVVSGKVTNHLHSLTISLSSSRSLDPLRHQQQHHDQNHCHHRCLSRHCYPYCLHHNQQHHQLLYKVITRYLQFYITHGCHHMERVTTSRYLQGLSCSILSAATGRGLGWGRQEATAPLLLWRSDHSPGLLSPWTTLQGTSQLLPGVCSSVGEDGFCATPEKKVFNPRKEIRGDTITVF